MRRGRNGDYHWVSPHDVTREGARGRSAKEPISDWPSPAFPRQKQSARPSSSRRRGLDTPNAKCPLCNKPVWFIRNENGGCAYFDQIGWPWPKHPCMATSPTFDHEFAARLALEYEEARRRGDKASWVRRATGTAAYRSPTPPRSSRTYPVPPRTHPAPRQSRAAPRPVGPPAPWQLPASRPKPPMTPEVIFIWCFIAVVLGVVLLVLLAAVSAP